MAERNSREADDVGEHHRHLALLRVELAQMRLVEQLADQRLGHIGLEPAQRRQHAVPGPARDVELPQGAGAQPPRAGEVEGRNRRRGVGETPDRPGQAPSQQQSENHGDGEDDQGGHAGISLAPDRLHNLVAWKINADSPGLGAEVRHLVQQHVIGHAVDLGRSRPALAVGSQPLLEASALLQHPIGQFHSQRLEVMG